VADCLMPVRHFDPLSPHVLRTLATLAAQPLQ
jgi:hypothetical protein